MKHSYENKLSKLTIGSRSPSKMDAVFLPEESRETLKDVFEMLDPEMGDALWLMCRMERREFEEELCTKFDVKSLKEIRVKVFRAALDKVDICLSQIARARTINPDLQDIDEERVQKADALLRVLTPQDMINRRCIKKLVFDIADLLTFIAREKAEFPSGMIKTSTADPSLGDDIKDAVECIQMIVTADAESSVSTMEKPTCDSEVEVRNETSSSTMEVSENTNVIHSDEEIFGDDHVSDLAADERGHGDCDLGLIRALICGEDSDHSTNNPMDEVMHGQQENLFDEIAKVGRNSSSNDPICPLLIISETSPKPQAQNVPPLVEYANSENDATIRELNLHNLSLSEQDQSHWPNTPCARTTNPVEVVSSNPVPPNQSPKVSPQPSVRRSVTVIESLPANDKSTSTADLWEHVIAESNSGCIYPEPYYRFISYDPMMSGNNAWAKKRHDPSRRDGACNECGKKYDELNEWKGDVARRVDNAVDTSTENTRKMSAFESEVKVELREMRRRMDLIDSVRGMSISGARPSSAIPIRAREMVEEEAGARGRPARRTGQLRNANEDQRRRAASFSGPIRSTSRSGRQKKVVIQDDPAPQICDAPPREQRERNRPSNKRAERPRENPIRDWLSSANQQPSKPASCNKQIVGEAEGLKSPSWADECGSDDDETGTSYASCSPAISTYDIDDDVTPERQHSVDCDEVVDVYQLPPSGQVSSRRLPSNDAEADAAYSLPRVNGAERNEKGQKLSQRRGNDNTRPQKDNRTKSKGNNVHENQGNNAQGTKPRNVSSKNTTTQKAKPDTGKKGMSYAKAVTENDWKVKQSKKRKFEKVSPRLSFPLKGSVSNTVRDVYLQGLDIEDGQNDDDVVDSVREYCNKHGITPVYIRIIPVKFDCTRTGVRLTVKSDDFERVINESFWPDLITVREWTQRNRDNRQNDNGNGRDASDDDN